MLGRTPEPASEDAPVNPIAHVSWRPDHEALVLAAPAIGCGRSSCGLDACTAAAMACVGDLFKAASNGLVRVVGDGNNHWPLVYERDLADLYVTAGRRHEDAAGVYHANDEGDERVNDIVEAISPYLSLRPDVRHVPIEEARAKMGSLCRRAVARSVAQESARPRARVDARSSIGVQQRRAPSRRVADGAKLNLVI